MAVFLKEPVRAGQLFPSPENGSTAAENPPVLTWLADGTHEYTVTVCTGQGGIFWQKTVTSPACVPDKVFPPGVYRWDVSSEGEHRGRWEFRIDDSSVIFLRPDAREILDSVPHCHPRHLFTRDEIPEILASHERELNVLRRNILQAYRDGLPQPPMYHRDPEALPYREYFGQYRKYCDRNLTALALGYSLLGDSKAGEFGKRLFLTLCSWDPEGPCSLFGPIPGDEIGLSNARCLPAVYDMLLPLLNGDERALAVRAVSAYAYQCEKRLSQLDFISNPGDSHSGRLPAYLGDAALVLCDAGTLPREVCERWLTYAAEVYGGIFPYYGTADGGWAEGVFYGSSYTKWYLPFFSAVERFTGKSYLSRPFYRNVSRFFLHFADPIRENHPFCDGYWCHPEDAEWPGFFAQDPLGIYAERYGPTPAKKRRAETPEPELFELHLLDRFLPFPKNSEKAPAPEDRSPAVFPEAGFAAMHTDPEHREKDLACLVHATKFGSGSHRHADQGNFALFYGKTALISPSGYFGRGYGTAHHMNWTNATKAHNCVLIDNTGQNIRDFRATGRIAEWGEHDGVQWLTMELSAAYPMLRSYTRTVRLEERAVVTEDRITADRPVTAAYLLHTLSPPRTDGRTVFLERNGCRLKISPVSGGLHGCTVSDRFDTPVNEGVEETYQVTMPPQYHLRWESAPACEHLLVMRLELTDLPECDGSQPAE